MVLFLKKCSSWLFSTSCALCHCATHTLHGLCLNCLQELPILADCCRQCAKKLPTGQHGLICGQCLQAPPPFDTTHALFSYQPPITKLMLNLKFNHAFSHAHLFGTLLAEKITQEWYLNRSLPSVIIPIPLHPQRIKERGFNQVVEIARPIAKFTAIPINTRSCQRTHATLAQATLSAHERKHNIKNAFSIQGNFSGQHVAVMDDVITTGQTITEFCRLLKKHGAKKIDVWCCAKAQILRDK